MQAGGAVAGGRGRGGRGRGKSPKAYRTEEKLNEQMTQVPEAKQEAAKIAVDQAADLAARKEEAKKKWKEEFYAIAKKKELSQEETKRILRLIEKPKGYDNNPSNGGKLTNPDKLNSCTVTFQEELYFRTTMLKRARSMAMRKAGDKLKIGKSETFAHDLNLDKLMDFIMRPGDEGTLSNLSQEEVQSRVEESKNPVLLNAKNIVDYICGPKIQRRFEWVKRTEVEKQKEEFDKGKKHPRKTAKDPGYCSNNLQDKDRKDPTLGYYVWEAQRFLPWIRAKHEDLDDFLPALHLMVVYADLLDKSNIATDHASNLTKQAPPRLKDPDASLVSRLPPPTKPVLNGFVMSNSKKPKMQDIMVDKTVCAQMQTVLCKIQNDKSKIFDTIWNSFSDHVGMKITICMNVMFDIVRSLLNSNAMVFSDRDGFKYDPTSRVTYRSLNDNMSYADEELRFLVRKYHLTDAHGTIDTATEKKVFCTPKMKKAGLRYELPPYVFYFDTKYQVLKLAEDGAKHFVTHYSTLYLKVAQWLFNLHTQYAHDYVQMIERMDDPKDPVYAKVDFLPLIKPFTDLEPYSKLMRCKRASFDDLEDASFPYPNNIFMDVTGDNRLVTNGDKKGCYITDGTNGWVRMEPAEGEEEVFFNPWSTDNEQEPGQTDEEEEEEEEEEEGL